MNLLLQSSFKCHYNEHTRETSDSDTQHTKSEGKRRSIYVVGDFCEMVRRKHSSMITFWR